MATDSDSFKFWRSYYDALKFLDTDKQRSEFVMGLCEYVFEGNDPTFSDAATEFGFRLVRKSAEESMLISRRARESGKRGGRPSKDEGKKRGAKSTAKRGAKRGAESVEKRSVAKRSYASSIEEAPPTGACAPGADAPAPAPEPWDSGDYPPPPPPPSP